MYKLYIKNIDDIKVNKEILDIINYANEDKKNISAKAWSLLANILLNEYNISLTKELLVYNQYNKPYLINNKLYFNISHSHQMIAIIISDQECGIDIEYIDYNKKINKVMDKVFSDKEKENYYKRKDKVKFFYKIWTKKEAYFKKIGTGIRYNELNCDVNCQNIKSYLIKNKKDKYYLSISL